MMLWAAWIATAFASDPVLDCAVEVRAPDPGQTSVVWVSPLRRRGTGWLSVVDSADLKRWMDREEPNAGDLLHHLGLRRTDRVPKRPYKVVIFDVDSRDLCLPSTEPNPSLPSACGHRKAGPERGQDACGRVIDPKTGDVGMQTYRAKWRELALRGFCLLPLSRFLEGS